VTIEGRWTPEFRAWFAAYMSAETDEAQLAALDAEAVRAADEIREALKANERCPHCGRPMISSEALAELLRELDQETSGAGAIMPRRRSEGPGRSRSPRSSQTRSELVGAKPSR